MISRKHAWLKKIDGRWTITDNKSVNGAFVNGKRSVPCEPVVLEDGDLLQLGVPPGKNAEPEFVWKYFVKLKVKKRFQPKTFETSIDCVDSESSYSSQDKSNVKKRIHSEDTDIKPSPPQARDPAKMCTTPSRHLGKRLKSSVHSPTAELKSKLKEQEIKSRDLMQEHDKQLRKMAELEELLAKKEADEKNMKDKLKQQEEKMQEELEKTKKKYEDQLMNKELSLKQRMALEKDILLAERDELQEQLQEELECKLGQKDEQLQEQLLKRQEDLQRVIEQKELKQKLLESELTATRAENEKQKEATLKAKEEVLANFSDMLETELQCSICNELFVQATSLNCSHSFCELCLEQWMALKKECPVCRAAITSQMRSIVLDSYIDRMIQQLNPEMKERREELVKERKEEKVKREAAKAAAAAGPSRRGSGRRGRGRTRGGTRTRGGRARNRAAQAASEPSTSTATAPPGVRTRSRGGAIVITSESDSDSNSDEDDNGDQDFMFHFVDSDDLTPDDLMGRYQLDSDSDDEGSVEGLPGHSYPGFGTCYRCGMRGHWAPGCPFF